MNTHIYDVIVIGGGASGLMVAGRAAEVIKSSTRGTRSTNGQNGGVLLLEKNKKLGEKLKITGGGRCNITNAEYDIRALLKHYGDAEQFLYSLFDQFGVSDTFTFFESRGLPLVVEERKRAFPKSHKALDVYAVLEKYITEQGVFVKTGSPVTKVNVEGTCIVSVQCGSEVYFAKKFICATGGTSHRETGSTGDGFRWLKDLGHQVISPTPSIVPLAVEEVWSKKLAGISLENMKITFFVDGVREFSRKGRLLFTHFGISGPLILNSASAVAELLPSGTVTASIDLFPMEDVGILDKRVVTIFDSHKNKMLKNVLGEIVPSGMSKGIEILIKAYNMQAQNQFGFAAIDINKQIHEVRVEERKALIRLLKALPLTIIGLMGDDRAVVSDGGVPLTEIDMKTMKSKVINNLYITGDLLHINRPSGGYSLQLCWTTGWVAGGDAGKD
jgi:predicted Rossmann fold flavoprotein